MAGLGLRLGPSDIEPRRHTGVDEQTSGATTCIILARGGSKGIPHKNLRLVGGVSLVGRSVRAALQAPSVAAVYVSTDDPDIAAEAERHGARIIWRPADLSNDKATSESGWLHGIAQMRADFPNLSRLVMLQCTSPFTTGGDIEACLSTMEQQKTDCALSVISDHSFLWTYDGAGRGIGVNHDHLSQRKRRQDLPPAFRESGAIYCARLEPFERVGQRFCGTVALCPVDHPPVEIDSADDLGLCTMIAQAGGVDVDRRRLEQVRAIIMDFDGVHTDNLVLTNQDGVEAVMTSRGDGLGLGMLRERGRWKLLIVSKERNPAVLARAAKLRINVKNAVDDKVAAIEGWMAENGLGWSDILYVGNDVNDLGPMQRAGLAACPQDAHPAAMAAAQWVLPHPGGKGAVRAMCDALLALTS